MLPAELWRALGDGGARYTLDGVRWPLQLMIWYDSRLLKDIASLAGKRVWFRQRGFLVEDMPYLLRLVARKQFREELVKSLDLQENYEAFLV